MEFIESFIHTLGLDSSFFIQLALAGGLYFLISRMLFKPYLQLVDKRQTLTKGRFDSSRQMEENIEDLKIQYEEKAKKVHKEFQKHFGEIKQKAEQDYKTSLEQLQKEQAQALRLEKERILKEGKDQMEILKVDIPHFVESLTEKLKGAS